MTIAYYLSKDMPVSITVADATGKPVRKLNGPAKAGINRALWDLNDDARNPLPPGDYVVTLNAGGRDYKQTAKFLSRAPGGLSREEDDSNHLAHQKQQAPGVTGSLSIQCGYCPCYWMATVTPVCELVVPTVTTSGCDPLETVAGISTLTCITPYTMPGADPAYCMFCGGTATPPMVA